MVNLIKKIKKVLPFSSKRKLHQQKELSNKHLENSKVLAQERSQLYEELNKKKNEVVVIEPIIIDGGNKFCSTVNTNDKGQTSKNKTHSKREREREQKEQSSSESEGQREENSVYSSSSDSETDSIDSVSFRPQTLSGATVIDSDCDSDYNNRYNQVKKSKQTVRNRIKKSLNSASAEKGKRKENHSESESEEEFFDALDNQPWANSPTSRQKPKVSFIISDTSTEKRRNSYWDNTPIPSVTDKKFDWDKENNKLVVNKLPNPLYHLKKHAGKYTAFILGLGTREIVNSFAPTQPNINPSTNPINLYQNSTNFYQPKDICLPNAFQPVDLSNNNSEITDLIRPDSAWDNLQNEINNQDRQIRKLKRVKKTQPKRAKKLTPELEQSNADYQNLNETYAIAKKALADKEKANQELTDKLADLATKLNQTTTDNNEQTAKLTDKIKELEKSNQELLRAAHQPAPEPSPANANSDILRNLLELTIGGTSILVNKAGYDKIKKLQKRKKDLQAKITNLKTQLNVANNQITQLNNDKTALATEKDNYQTKYQQEKLRADNLQNWKDNHTCSYSNYEDKEQQIIQGLNITLKLGLETPTLKQVIIRIQELINKDPITITDNSLATELQRANQTITKLEKELVEKNTPFGEDLAIIKQLDCQSLAQLFPQQFDNYTKQQIQQATNYQQLVSVRQDFFHKHLRQNQDNSITNQPQQELTKQPKQERIIWIGLLVLSLLTMGGLLVKWRGLKNKRQIEN